jgi:hypothetical protein
MGEPPPACSATRCNDVAGSRVAGSASTSLDPLARLAGKIAPERSSRKSYFTVGHLKTEIVVNGRIVTVQRTRPQFAV